MTFWIWPGKQTKREDPVGDFAREAMQDKNARKRLRTPTRIITEWEPVVGNVVHRAVDEWSNENE